MSAQSYVRWFIDIWLEDLPLVGGKSASLGELYSTLSSEGISVPNGFALTAEAYRDALAPPLQHTPPPKCARLPTASTVDDCAHASGEDCAVDGLRPSPLAPHSQFRLT